MNLFRLMVWKEFRHIRADKLSIRLMIFPVFAQLLVMGYALTTEVKNIDVAIVDECMTPDSRSLGETIRGNPLLRFHSAATTVAEARRRMDRGEIKAAIVLPADFSRSLAGVSGAKVQLLVDGQDANSANVSRGYLNAIVTGWAQERLRRSLSAQGIRIASVIPVGVTPVILFNPLLKSTWYMVSGLVVILVTIITGLLSGLSIVKEKEAGTLEQLMVTPLSPLHLIVGKTVPYFLIGIAELSVFLVLAVLWFQIPFRGNFFVFLLFGMVYMFSSLGIGILTSTVARTPQQVLFLIWFIMIFFILLSGFFIPVENMPEWVQEVSCINPVRYCMFAIREMFLKGSGIAELWRELLGMAAIGGVVFGASVLLFHRRTS